MSDIEEKTINDLTEQRIINYLKNHRDFFVRHPKVLADLTLRHPSGKAISLLERQIQLLREKNQTFEQRLRDLHVNGADNDLLLDYTQKLALDLIGATSFKTVIESIYDNLANNFEAQALSLWLVKNTHELPEYEWLIQMPEAQLKLKFGSFIDKVEIYAQDGIDQPVNDLFPRNPYIGSCIIMPLHQEGFHGILAIGNADPDHFTPDMDTLFVNHIAQMVSHAIAPFFKEAAEYA